MIHKNLPLGNCGKRSAIALLVCLLGISVASAQAPPAQVPPDENPSEPKPSQNAAPSSGLPSDFKPPRAIPPVMTFNKELMSENESQALGIEVTRVDKITTVLNNATLNNNTKAIVEKWAKWRLYQMTLKSNRKRLHEVRAELMREIGYAGNSSRVPRKDVELFRSFLCEEVTKRATELLSNNFHVRLNAAIVLAQLNLTDENTSKQMPEQAYVKAAIPLLDVLTAKTGGGLDEQLEAVKIQAAIGLGRITLVGAPGDLNINVQGQNLRNLIAKTLIAQLQDPSAHEWYQMRLIDALGSIDLVNDVSTGRPIIVQQLGELLADRQRPFPVRARAARSLGRCPLPAGLNTEKLVFQILLLQNEMALAYQKNPGAYYWLGSFSDLYYAFHPVTDTESKLYGSKRPPGLNQKNLGNLAREAYQQLLPITAHVVNQRGWIIPKDGEKRARNEPIPDQMISDLAAWLQDHQPSSHKLAPNLPDLDPTSPLPTASAGSTTSG